MDLRYKRVYRKHIILCQYRHIVYDSVLTLHTGRKITKRNRYISSPVNNICLISLCINVHQSG